MGVPQSRCRRCLGGADLPAASAPSAPPETTAGSLRQEGRRLTPKPAALAGAVLGATKTRKPDEAELTTSWPLSEAAQKRAVAAWPNLIFSEFEYPTPSFLSRANLARMSPVEPSDVFVCSYPKSGTNWVKQIVHLLRLKGDRSLVKAHEDTDLSVLVPLPEADPTIDFGALLQPRAVFTHLRLGDLPVGGKKIYVMRDPVDVCPSYYEYVKTFGPVFFPEHTVDDAAELLMDGLMGWGTWEEHVASYWAERGQKDLLFVKYEDIRRDHAGQVRRIAAFLGLDLTPEQQGEVVKMSARDYMAARNDKVQGKEWVEKVTGCAVSDAYALVGDGRKRAISATTAARLRAHFEKQQQAIFGTTYSDLDATA